MTRNEQPSDKPLEECSKGCCGSKPTSAPKNKGEGCRDRSSGEHSNGCGGPKPIGIPEKNKEGEDRHSKPPGRCSGGCCGPKPADGPSQKNKEGEDCHGKASSKCAKGCCGPKPTDGPSRKNKEGEDCHGKTSSGCTKGCCGPKPTDEPSQKNKEGRCEKPSGEWDKGCCGLRPTGMPGNKEGENGRNSSGECSKGCCGSKPASIPKKTGEQDCCEEGRERCKPGRERDCRSGKNNCSNEHEHKQGDDSDEDSHFDGDDYYGGRKSARTENICCPSDQPCSCNEGCAANYAELLHQQTGCRRTNTVRPDSSSELGILTGEPKKLGRGVRLACANCLHIVQAMSNTCYCSLTRRLANSVKSLTAVEFASGCCNVGRVRDEIKGHGECGIGVTSKQIYASDEKQHENMDIEAGPTFSRRLELGVTGMHCSGCADEVAGVLQRIPGVGGTSVQVNFVLSRGEMRYDPAIVTDVNTHLISAVHRRFPGLDIVTLLDVDAEDTEYGLVKVRLSAKDGEAAEMKKLLSDLDIRVTLTGPSEVEICYDPGIIGIRKVLSILRSGNPNLHGGLELKPPPDGTEIAVKAEARHLRSMWRLMLLCLIFTIPVLVLAWSGERIKMRPVTRYGIECACATVVLGIARRIYLDAAMALIYGRSLVSRVNMDSLVSVATLSAYIFSTVLYAIHAAKGDWESADIREPFYETSTLLTLLILLGRWCTSKVRAWASEKLRTVGNGRLDTDKVRYTDKDTESIKTIDVLELEYDDVVHTKQGEQVATDGLVISGVAQVDESHLTGEPKPQPKEEGSLVKAGSTVVAGELSFRVTKVSQENTISTLKGLVKLATAQKPKSQERADRVAAVLTPTVLLLALAIFLIWLLVNGLGKRSSWGASAVNAATYAVATLAISCPCAIALAVPLVLVIGSRVAVSKGGIVFKNITAVEKGCKVGKVIFDKTGTLTSGQLVVESAWSRDNGAWNIAMPEATKNIVRQLCARSDHPVAKAVFRWSLGSPADPNLVTQIATTDCVGQGIEADINGVVYRGGKLSFTAPQMVNDPATRERLSKAQSIFTLSVNQELIAIFALKDDEIRPEVPHLLADLRSRGIEVFIFSGDRAEAVKPIAQALQIPQSNVYGDCTPEHKRARLEILKQANSPASSSWFAFRKKRQQKTSVVFIGDGTNDAIALAAADVGISLSRSTEMATTSADVAILSDSLLGLSAFLDLSRRMDLCIRINIGWALVFNVIAILGASGAWVDVRIPPEWAGLGEVGSVLPVFVVSALVGWGYRRRRH